MNRGSEEAQWTDQGHIESLCSRHTKNSWFLAYFIIAITNKALSIVSTRIPNYLNFLGQNQILNKYFMTFGM